MILNHHCERLAIGFRPREGDEELGTVASVLGYRAVHAERIDLQPHEFEVDAAQILCGDCFDSRAAIDRLTSHVHRQVDLIVLHIVAAVADYQEIIVTSAAATRPRVDRRGEALDGLPNWAGVHVDDQRRDRGAWPSGRCSGCF